MDKGLIKNKKLLCDLIEKEKGYRNVENTSDNESNNEESSSDIGNQEEEEEGVASENRVETEGTQESDNDTENDSEETESSSPVSYTHLRAHETDSYLVCRLLLEKKNR